MNLPLLLLVLALDSPTQPGAGAATDARIEFENPWVRVVRVHYGAHEKTAVHDHPSTPTVYVYVTNGGRLRIEHEGEEPVIRPPVREGGIRFQKGVLERHSVEELDGVESEYIRLELKTQPLDLPDRDVRRAPDDRTPFENRMLRILRVTCAPRSACPPSAHPENPAIVVTGRKAIWIDANAVPLQNPASDPLDQVRVELKTPPLP